MSNNALTQTIVTGSDPRALPEFSAIREEINKANHPSQPELNWKLVESLALSIFKANGVDLHTATYYTLARTRNQGLAGFCEGAELLAAMIIHEWDKFWPQSGPARTEMLDWFNTRTGNILRQQVSFSENDLSLLYRTERALQLICDKLQQVELKRQPRVENLLYFVQNTRKRFEPQPRNRTDTAAQTMVRTLVYAPEGTASATAETMPPLPDLPEMRVGVRGVADNADKAKQGDTVKGFVAGAACTAVIASALWWWQAYPMQQQLTQVRDTTQGAATVWLASPVLKEYEQYLQQLLNAPPLQPLETGMQMMRTADTLWPESLQQQEASRMWSNTLRNRAQASPQMKGWQQARQNLRDFADLMMKKETEKQGFTLSYIKTVTWQAERLLNQETPLEYLLTQYQETRTQKQDTQALEKEINERLDVVGHFVEDADLADTVREQVALVGDMERIASRIAAARVTPRELVQLKNSLFAVELLKAALESTDDDRLHALAAQIDLMTGVRDRIAREIYPDPLNNQIQKGGVIADGVDPELDDLRRIALHGKDYLARIQQRESETTGIPSLKISYNNVFGYYIEVRNAHKDKVPQSWIRKQTLANAERYITEELKEYEEKILGAEEKMLVIEQRIYADIIAHISRSLAVLLRDAAVVARVDCLQSFARIACERRYVRPVLDDGKRIDIRQGRHPVIETLMPVGEEYIPNDVLLDDKEQQIMMITGPNMSGKSALLRQTALIILMAQMGSFVPAKSAHIGVVDKIFTRVGASDNISQGESTFMVEMLESASILNNISDRSIVLLDEIGRGTSTYDGISIAWAMVEYLHNHPTAHAKTLFATHYHELNEMEQMCPRVKNYHVSVKEMGNQIVFLRKLERGGTEHSFGIHVARMAGMPMSVVSRADEILRNLELVYGNNEIVPSRSLKSRGKKPSPSVREAAEAGAPQNMQLSMFQLDDPVLVQIRDQIKGLDIDSLTPIEALNKLNEIKKITGI